VKGKKRILVLTSTFPRWEYDEDPPFVSELCRRLKEHYRVHVLAPHYSGTETEEYLVGIHVRRFRYFFSPWERLAYQGGILAKLKHNPWQYGLLPFFFLGELLALIRLLRSYRFHLIHAHWLIPQGLVALLARLFIKSAPPLLCTSHGGDLFGLQGTLLNKLKRIILTHSTAVTVVSRAMHDEVIKLDADHDKVHVIPMGVDLQNRFVPPEIRANNASLLFVGRLVEKKGLSYLIDALPLILKRHPNVRLRIAGDGPEKMNLKIQCVKLGICDHVRFLGAVKNELLPALYQTSGVLVFPSVIADDGDREGFGLVVVEALGCECATVVTDLPAMQDIIVDGKTGLVVPQKNIRKLAEKVVLLLDDQKLRESLGREGRRHVLRNFDWTIIAEKYRKLIESISCQPSTS
jgi:glycosyltransferase involved in cell wall biosynthesis